MYEEGEIACVRLYGRWPPRVGIGSWQPCDPYCRIAVSYRSCFDDYVPIQRSLAESEPQETEASLLNYQSAWFERHERDDASIATDKPYCQ
jgi:hypothetical protein